MMYYRSVFQAASCRSTVRTCGNVRVVLRKNVQHGAQADTDPEAPMHAHTLDSVGTCSLIIDTHAMGRETSEKKEHCMQQCLARSSTF